MYIPGGPSDGKTITGEQTVAPGWQRPCGGGGVQTHSSAQNGPGEAAGQPGAEGDRPASVWTLVVASTVCSPLLQLQGLLREGGRAPEGELQAPSAPLPTSEGRGGKRLRPQGSPASPAPPTERDRASSVKNDAHTPGRTRRQSTATGELPT